MQRGGGLRAGGPLGALGLEERQVFVERAAFADNSVKYEATLRFINGSVRTMLDAMKSHHGG